MAKTRLFGDQAPGAMSIVDAPVSRLYARKARTAFFVVGIVVCLVTAALSSAVLAWPAAVVLGLACVAGVVYLYVLARP